MSTKTLILYGTRKGTTTKTAEVISTVLNSKFSHETEIINVREFKKVKNRLKEFNNIIIGSSIVSGRWVGKCLRILRKYKFDNQKLAIFVTAGGTMNKIKKYGHTKQEVIQEGILKYINIYIKKYKLDPLAKMVFGGKVVKKDKIKFDNWNKEDIQNWATGLGKLL